MYTQLPSFVICLVAVVRSSLLFVIVNVVVADNVVIVIVSVVVVDTHYLRKT